MNISLIYITELNFYFKPAYISYILDPLALHPFCFNWLFRNLNQL